MKNYIWVILCNLIIIINLNSQTYCLTISVLSSNSSSITYSWSLDMTESCDASLQITGTNDLEGSAIIGEQALGQPAAGPYSGTFMLSKKIPGGTNYTYTVADLGVFTRGNGTTMSSNCAPLPITLSTFSATKHSERASKLDWHTSSEINSDNFGIERSRDGDTWETISQVVAAGNSSEVKYYEYIDDKLPFSRSKDQIFYYRLRLTDQDGSFKYSDIKGVNFNRQTADGVIAVYPNPATQMVHIDVVGMDESQGETKLRIFDMCGRVMLDKAILGSGLEPVDVLQYPSGVYNISVTQGDKLHQKQFIKVE